MHAMSTTKVRQQVKAMVDELSGPQLRVASEFLAFMKSRQTDDATMELLKTPGFKASFERGKKDIAEGRTKPWREVRRDV
jgi:hypothetical protein